MPFHHHFTPAQFCNTKPDSIKFVPSEPLFSRPSLTRIHTPSLTPSLTHSLMACKITLSTPPKTPSLHQRLASQAMHASHAVSRDHKHLAPKQHVRLPTQPLPIITRGTRPYPLQSHAPCPSPCSLRPKSTSGARVGSAEWVPGHPPPGSTAFGRHAEAPILKLACENVRGRP
jgi:hypothetical protein